MMMKRLMMVKIHNSRRGASPVIGAILMVLVAVAAMAMTTSYSQNIIDSESARMAERLAIEEVLFDVDHIQIYARNIGETNIILEQVKINGVLIDLPQKIYLASKEANLNSMAEVVIVEGSFEEGVYAISFVSSLNKDLGSIEVQYSLKPRITIIEPTYGQKINDATPKISAIVSDSSGIDDIQSISMKLDERIISYQNSSLTPYDISVFYEVPSSESLDETIRYHFVSLEVVDGMKNLATKTWWFELDMIPPSIVSIIHVENVSSSSLMVEWFSNPEPDISHYHVYSGTSPRSYSKVVDCPSTAKSYLDVGLTPATKYYYVVTAVDEAGNESVYSLEKVGLTQS